PTGARAMRGQSESCAAFPLFQTLAPIRQPQTSRDTSRGSRGGYFKSGRTVGTDRGNGPPACLPGSFRRDVTVEVELVARVAVHGFVGQLPPPGDIGIGNVDLIDVREGEQGGGSSVAVQLRKLQGRNFNCSVQFRISEWRHSAAGIRINVIVH